ncbi:jg8744 [Pararge aegeria aegeria]|uniref:Jg8744 protein n=1 Tax=Pararge aegeria aegeria TaxID=348720 RepID=A0A8S4QUH4_9NEOP|nr:jg8744 [Pararge aegeria aegeria]
MAVGVPRCWNGCPALVSAALVDPQRGGQTTSSASQVAAGSKRHRTVYCETPYKRPMSSSGRRLVEIMMMLLSVLSTSFRPKMKLMCCSDCKIYACSTERVSVEYCCLFLRGGDVRKGGGGARQRKDINTPLSQETNRAPEGNQ